MNQQQTIEALEGHVHTNKKLLVKTSGMAATDGDGVKMTRIIGTHELNTLDPFLLLDAVALVPMHERSARQETVLSLELVYKFAREQLVRHGPCVLLPNAKVGFVNPFPLAADLGNYFGAAVVGLAPSHIRRLGDRARRRARRR